MEYIIQQITQKLLTKITEKALNGGIHDIDALASDVLTDCKSAASRMIEAICHDINLRTRGDKEGRQMHGLLLKERARELHIYADEDHVHMQKTRHMQEKNKQH